MCVQPSQEVVSHCKGVWKNVISLWFWVWWEVSPKACPVLPESASLDLLFLIFEKNLQSLTPRRQENVWMMKHALSDVLSNVLVPPLLFSLPLVNSTRSHTLAHFHKCKGQIKSLCRITNVILQCEPSAMSTNSQHTLSSSLNSMPQNNLQQHLSFR